MKILLLEDDALLRELMVEHLSDNYETVIFDNGEDTLEYLYENRVDLALLDINVPGLKGDELLKILRKERNTTPVIFITSNDSSSDVKKGFDLGCDDYIKKPFEFEELDARIEHVKRIYGLEEKIKIGDFLFDPVRHLLVNDKDGETIQLTPKASEILHYLYTHKVVTKEDLIANIWNYDEVPSEATIRSYIKTLRKIFPNIKTIRGSGYEFEPL
ncbi:response regulator transcription factor [Nitratiruptor tergarcus]|uniref:DNA-binding response regulator, OmpR family, contains REC and winged-helix (WHTH) domain n=1 Tax=Nitratiruptor tergarcus DSM 16512 TaxID=1069081 RepID=A0A1W1WTR6_9BACT|nr:response regulator transcription factor [Nitratiruptor tergarcus]SMC09714.1 DNA-binding response regulator, OmpR family, contains REC and winged-helix (wHTH) domain [Nitratiruptor tergarcus DSM 16512]